MQPIEKVRISRDILRPIMDKSGFKWQEGNDVDTAGKQYSWGQFVNGERKIRLAFGTDLCLLRYHLGKHVLSHQDFMALIGVESPSFTSFDDTLEKSIEDIVKDLNRYGKSFLDGSVVDLLEKLG